MHDGKPAIVLCADTQGTDFAKSSDVRKISPLRDTGFKWMYCDRPGIARELASAIGPAAEAFNATSMDDVAVTQLIFDINQITKERKRLLVQDHIERTYGLDVSEFYKVATENERYAVANKGFECELLLTHAGPREAFVLHVNNQGLCSWEDNYKGIGSGWVIARSVLAQKDWNYRMNVLEAAGRLLFAKRSAEKDVYVSKETPLFASFAGHPALVAFSDAGVEAVEANNPRIKWPENVPEATDDMFEYV